ncbi:hypothetical protein [Streptomyces sp. NPDC002537]
MIAELGQDGPPNRRGAGVPSTGRRRGRRTRRAAVVAAVALGAALLVPPASAVGPGRTGVAVPRTVSIGATGTSAVSALASTHRVVPLAHRAAVVHRTTAAKPKKKKKGFFQKLGIFLLVVLILVVLFVIGMIWLVIHMVRRAIRRR